MIVKKQFISKGLLINYYSYVPKVCERNIVFLHGWRSDGMAWNKVMSDLNLESTGMYALDLPGFGQSQIPESAYHLNDYVNVVLEFISKLNLNKVILVGHSFGGRISIKLAAQHDVRMLVLVDSAGIKNTSLDKNIKSGIAKIVKPFFQLPGLKTLRKNIYTKMGSEDYVATPYLRDTFLNIINEDLKSDMELIRVPTAIIWGENDKDTPMQIAQTMHLLIKGSQLFIVKDAGHFSFIDQPQEFTTILKKLIYERSI